MITTQVRTVDSLVCHEGHHAHLYRRGTNIYFVECNQCRHRTVSLSSAASAIKAFNEAGTPLPIEFVADNASPMLQRMIA